MDLYDDLDTKQRAGQIDGWSQSYQMLQTQLALKKAAAKPAPKTTSQKRMLTPVMMLKSKKDDIDIFKPVDQTKSKTHTVTTISTSNNIHHVTPSNKVFNEYDWDVVDEYDPLWPNEYEKLIKDKRDKEMEKTRGRSNRKSNMRFENESPPSKFTSGFGGRPIQPDDEESIYRSPPSGSQGTRSGGAAIAPPPSLQESTPIIPPTAFASNSEGKSPNVASYGSNSVAAKIMAKYGFKDGQGLGKQEQGMSIALQVEKTSKRGGRIIHEKELMLPPAPPSPPPAMLQVKEQPTITEIMKAPSTVVLLRNMVGPGDVDNDLEPEVKDECNTKYGEVVSVIINELTNVEPEEAVRIFVEFKRIESATKAVVDLNGRFFGGRQNMVGPGDVDNDLEPEVKDECNTKYGEVVSVIINELTNVEPEEAVRIFVEFKRIESATKAVVDLNGRFFGGRQVRAGFFCFDKYKAYQLYD